MANRHRAIVVLGGGPAGAAAAMSLTALGHHALLVSAPRHQPAIEGFSDRTMQALATLGFARALEAVGPKVGRQAFWGGRESRNNSEYVVERDRFDKALLVDADAGGVEVRQERAGRVIRQDGVWHVRLASGESLTTDFLVEARGRAAPAPSGGRSQGPATVSLARIWDGVDNRPATTVAALRDGWAWYASTGDGRALLQFLVSARPGELPKRQGLTVRYDELLRDADLPRQWIADATGIGEVVVRRANPVGAERPVGRDIIRIGDAAVAPDPLSGHGVFVALGGAQAAAITVNTLLKRPENSGLARRFYEERCQSDFLRLCRVGRAFYEQERRWEVRPFWRERTGWPDRKPPHPPMDSFAARIERRPVVDHGFVSEGEVVVTPDHPRGVWVVDGVPLVSLYRALTAEWPAPDNAALSERLSQPVEAIATARQWLALRFEKII